MFKILCLFFALLTAQSGFGQEPTETEQTSPSVLQRIVAGIKGRWNDFLTGFAQRHPTLHTFNTNTKEEFVNTLTDIQQYLAVLLTNKDEILRQLPENVKQQFEPAAERLKQLLPAISGFKDKVAGAANAEELGKLRQRFQEKVGEYWSSGLEPIINISKTIRGGGAAH